MILYDNVKDASDKLVGTTCMFDNKACLVRAIELVDEDGKKPFTMTLSVNGKRDYVVSTIDDPKFDFRHFNIGYCNQHGSSGWWFRIPHKQFRQGLRSDQMKASYSKPDFHRSTRWEYSKAVCTMLENEYPTLDRCEKLLRDDETSVMAFDKDFALSYDHIHKDLIIEHRARLIGQMSNIKNYTLLSEYKYLRESLEEILSVS